MLNIRSSVVSYRVTSLSWFCLDIGWFGPLFLYFYGLKTTLNNKQTEMKLTSLLFFSMLSILTSCNGQNSHSKNHSAAFEKIKVKGDTVKELGNSIMVMYRKTFRKMP